MANASPCATKRCCGPEDDFRGLKGALAEPAELLLAGARQTNGAVAGPGGVDLLV
jgi:hypothetical protein